MTLYIEKSEKDDDQFNTVKMKVLLLLFAVLLLIAGNLAMPADKLLPPSAEGEPKITKKNLAEDLEGSESAYAVYPFPYYPAYYHSYHYPYIIYG